MSSNTTMEQADNKVAPIDAGAHATTDAATNAPVDANTQARTALSGAAFSNPQDFLKVLKTDMNQISPDGYDEITPEKLNYFADKAADPQEKAAAQIALAHYPDLLEMTKLPIGDNKIYPGAADQLLNYEHGKTTQDIVFTEAFESEKTLGLAGGSAALIAASGPVSGFATPFAGAVLAAGGVAAAVGAVDSAYQQYTTPGYIRSLAKNDVATLASWNEINARPAT